MLSSTCTYDNDDDDDDDNNNNDNNDEHVTESESEDKVNFAQYCWTMKLLIA